MANTNHYLKYAKNLFAIFFGNTIYAVGIVAFLLPNGIITGGTTGLALSAQHYLGLPLSTFAFIFNAVMFILGALILGKAFALTTLISSFYYPVILGQHYLGLPLSTFAFIFNAVMFILGALILGKAFALTTLISSFYYPVILGILQKVPALSNVTQDRMLAMFILGALILGKAFALTTLISSFYYPVILGILQKVPALSNVTQDRMLACVCSGVLIGAGIGIVIRAGASTGGMDIPPLLLKRFFGIPVSASLYVFDFVILLLEMTFSNVEEREFRCLRPSMYSTS